MPSLLTTMHEQGVGATIYVARDLSDTLTSRLVGQQAQSGIVVRTPVHAVPTYARLIRGFPYWPRQVQQDNLDLFHTAYYPIPNLRIPIVLTVNDLRFLHLPESYTRLRRQFLRTVVGPSVRKAARIIAISEDTKRDLMTHFNIPDSRIDVVYIPVDPHFKPIENQAELSAARLKYGLPLKYVLCIGHLEPRKNLDRLVQAFLSLRQVGDIDHKLVILGRKSFGFEQLLAQVGEQNLEEDVIFTGYVDDEDMPAVISQASMLAFPSLHEGFGVPLLEAMACGTPVLTSNLSALPEVAGDAALLVDPYDVADIANGMGQILNDDHLQQSLIEKGFARVKLFDAQKAALGILDSYRKALS